jgi:hypothetical protein
MKLVAVLLVMLVMAAAAATYRDVKLDVPTRLMWGREPGVPGYCGETSYQMHGIFWGNWISTEHVHYAAGTKELLLGNGDNQDVNTAKKLKFGYEVFNNNGETPDSAMFLRWVKKHIDQGRIVAFGGFGITPKGKDGYDHIMPIFGYRADASSGAVLGVWLSDLYEKEPALVTKICTRQECTGPDSEPALYGVPKDENFAIAFTGFTDVKKETFRTKLVMPSWTEPDWGHADGLDETPVMFTIKAVVSGLTIGSRYSILRFSSLSKLPSSNFIHGQFTKRVDFTATAKSMTLDNFDKFLSSSTMFYRTVLNTHPLPPTTRPPTTNKPTTAKPTTKKPTTAKPTTKKPTTAKPTTKKP